MKKAVFLFFLISFTFNFCQSQEWMNSLDVAKRLALVQDKMLFVVWENTEEVYDLEEIELLAPVLLHKVASEVQT